MSRFDPSADMGFTLLETLVTLAVMASVATVVATSVRQPSDHMVLKKRTALLAREMADVQNTAIGHGVAKSMTVSYETCNAPTTIVFFPNGMAKGDEICLISGDVQMELCVNPMTGRLRQEAINEVQ
jgi:prepilin-type N-terminal cleavage/methylation domain-containing protein